VNFLVWKDLGEVYVAGTRTALSVTEFGRVVAFVEDHEGCLEYIVETFLSLADLASKHPDWLRKITLKSEDEHTLHVFEQLLEADTIQSAQ
jgi:hypothetical protein